MTDHVHHYPYTWQWLSTIRNGHACTTVLLESPSSTDTLFITGFCSLNNASSCPVRTYPRILSIPSVDWFPQHKHNLLHETKKKSVAAEEEKKTMSTAQELGYALIKEQCRNYVLEQRLIQVSQTLRDYNLTDHQKVESLFHLMYYVFSDRDRTLATRECFDLVLPSSTSSGTSTSAHHTQADHTTESK